MKHAGVSKTLALPFSVFSTFSFCLSGVLAQVDKVKYAEAVAAWEYYQRQCTDLAVTVEFARDLKLSSSGKNTSTKYSRTIKVSGQDKRLSETTWIEKERRVAGDIVVECLTPEHAFLLEKPAGAVSFALLNYRLSPGVRLDAIEAEVPEVLRPISAGIGPLFRLNEFAKLVEFRLVDEKWRCVFERRIENAPAGEGMWVRRIVAYLEPVRFHVIDYELEYTDGTAASGSLKYERSTDGNVLLAKWNHSESRKGDNAFTEKILETYSWDIRPISMSEFSVEHYGLKAPEVRSYRWMFFIGGAIALYVLGVAFWRRQRRSTTQ